MNKYILLIAIVSSLLLSSTSNAQTQKKVIQLSGLVVGGDSAYGVPGVYLYVPKAGRGTASNYLGYFSLPVLVGDSLLVKAIGFKEKQFVIPDAQEKLSVVIELSEDTSYMPSVEVFPWPTEKLFKEAFLSLTLPEQERDYMRQNLNDKVMARMLYNLPDDGSQNHRYYIQQQQQRADGRYMYPTLSLLNPFAWNRFIRSAKKGGLKETDVRDRDIDEREDAVDRQPNR
ncbi:MAG TPA: carboxypeptidase-like regulatory domain-containing protein [Cytophagaceae bacterium]|jgi:hypothetical protein